MANEVTKNVFGGAVKPIDMQRVAERAKESAVRDARGGAPDGSFYLNFSGKKGVYTLGDAGGKERKIDEEETWVVNIMSFQDGWVCWKGGKPAAARMENIYGDAQVATPDMNEFGPFDTSKGDGWYSAKAVVMRSLDTEEQGYLRLNSVSGTASLSELLDAFSERVREGKACWPVIRLEKEEFKAQGFTNSKPLFPIIGWLDEAGLAVIASGEDYDIDDLLVDSVEVEDAPAPVPATRSRRRG